MTELTQVVVNGAATATGLLMTDGNAGIVEALSPDELLRGGNALLTKMMREDLVRLGTAASRVKLMRGDVLIEPNERIRTVYFIESGVASVIKSREGRARVEICMLGPESFSGIPLISGDGRWPYYTFVQTEELHAVQVSAEDLLSCVARSNALRALLVRSVHALMVQIAEGLVGAAWQTINSRLARWLLMYRHRLDSDRIPVTHEFIALMVGSQRTGITLALHELEDAGMIAASRGLIVIRDRQQLERLADESYGTAECEYDRLLS